MGTDWSFYGRLNERRDLTRLIRSGRWFFCAITGRRRIGKTTLVRAAVKDANSRAFYVQIPDTDQLGVVQAFRAAVEDHELTKLVSPADVRSFADVAKGISVLCQHAIIVVVDEFQYFHRKALHDFTSYFQAEIDKLRDTQSGGVFVLGSIHTEMTAILEEKDSPLFNRITDRLELGHWDFATLFEMFGAHGVDSPRCQLFFWSLFEGVPKFYRDAHDQGVLADAADHRRHALKPLFFEGLSPLKDEAQNWFLRELRGRYDSLLKVLAARQPCSHAELIEAYKTEAGDERQVAGYLKILIDRYRMVEAQRPIFSHERSRKARYVVTDNFLSAWLVAIGRAADLARIQPVNKAVALADERLANYEGFAFERLVRLLLAECSRAEVGPISLTQMTAGYWNRPEKTNTNVEIDVVGVDEENKEMLFGSCKRRADRHSLNNIKHFCENISLFLNTKDGRPYSDFRIRRALFAPEWGQEKSRQRFEEEGFMTLDIKDLKERLCGIPEDAEHV